MQTSEHTKIGMVALRTTHSLLLHCIEANVENQCIKLINFQ